MEIQIPEVNIFTTNEANGLNILEEPKPKTTALRSIG